MMQEYIAVLELANGKDYVTEEQILSTLKKSQEMRSMVQQMLNSGALFHAHFVMIQNIRERVFSIRPQECFQLLEHEELKQARRSSMTATIIAIVAVGCNITSILLMR